MAPQESRRRAELTCKRDHERNLEQLGEQLREMFSQLAADPLPLVMVNLLRGMEKHPDSDLLGKKPDQINSSDSPGPEHQGDSPPPEGSPINKKK